MNEDFYQESVTHFNPQDVPLVFGAAITGVPEATADTLQSRPEARPLTALNINAIQILSLRDGTAVRVSHLLALSLEALAQIAATTLTESELWSDSDRTRYHWLVDQNINASRSAKKKRETGL